MAGMASRSPLAPLPVELLSLAAAASLAALSALAMPATARASSAVPSILEQPGTVPLDAALEAADGCKTCHGGYDRAVSPHDGWQGTMMANAARDPVMWAALEVAEQDLVANTAAWAKWMPASTPETGGAGDLCLRCHAPAAWLGGRSTPTSGSALSGSDFEGVGCDLCHRLVDSVSAEGKGMVRPGREAFWTNPRTA